MRSVCVHMGRGCVACIPLGVTNPSAPVNKRRGGLQTVEVGYSVTRPVVPDERTAFVLVDEPTNSAATLLAAQIVAATRGVEMVTRTTLVR